MVAKGNFRIFGIYEKEKLLFLGKASCCPSEFLYRYKHKTSKNKKMQIVQYLSSNPDKEYTIKLFQIFKTQKGALNALREFIYDFDPIYNTM